MEVLQFALLGLGVGATYVLIGQGIVLIYRGSGVLNFAQGGIAMVTAEVFYALRDGDGLPPAAALFLALALAALLGAVMGFIVVRLLATASALARLIATLGFLATAQGVAAVAWASDDRAVSGLFPTTAIRLGAGLTISADRLCLAGLGLALTAALWWVYQRTRYGTATSAVAENQPALELLGWSPIVIGTANWVIGSLLAGLAGIVLSPIAGLSPDVLVLTVIPALAAAIVGRVSSFWLTLVGGLMIGVIQSEMTQYVKQQGWSDAVPFLVIIALVVFRGRALPIRGDQLDRPVRAGTGRVRPGVVIAACVIAGLVAHAASDSWLLAITSSALMGIVCLSLVLITGYAGQVSFAQLTLAGIGALTAANAAYHWHTPFLVSVAVGTVAAAAVGVLVGLPALRCRGVNLAVVTIGLSLVIEELVLGNVSLTGGYAGFQVPAPTVFGYSFSSLRYPLRFTLLAVAGFALCALITANLRRSPTGRRLLAVRSNERAAASSGVSVTGAKLFAFGVASAMAGFSGALAIFQYPQLNLTPYTTVASINLLVMTVIGGIGYIGGAFAGGLTTPGGVVSQLLSALNGSLTDYLTLIGGIAVLKILIFAPNGLTDVLTRGWSRGWSGRLPRRAARAQSALPPPSPSAVPPPAVPQRRGARLSVESLAVRFGGVHALSGVSLTVEPGEVVGLLGPNGSGKTTLIDAVTGLVKADGSIMVDGIRVDRLSPLQRARHGIGRTFQGVELFDDLSVGENVQVAAEDDSLLSRFRDLALPRRSPLSATTRAAVDELGLNDELGRDPGELPTGRRRLAGIARTLAGAPKILLLDEPAAGLDDAETRELGRLIRRLADEWHLAVLLIEHDVQLIAEVTDRVVALELGRVIACGTASEVLATPAVRAAYLGGPAQCPLDVPVAPEPPSGTPRLAAS